jgi:hypothetical protein
MGSHEDGYYRDTKDGKVMAGWKVASRANIYRIPPMKMVPGLHDRGREEQHDGGHR